MCREVELNLYTTLQRHIPEMNQEAGCSCRRTLIYRQKYCRKMTRSRKLYIDLFCYNYHHINVAAYKGGDTRKLLSSDGM